ncbi:hypothetical protein GCM10020254_66820 [Streptomyces goshikiensis]
MAGPRIGGTGPGSRRSGTWCRAASSRAVGSQGGVLGAVRVHGRAVGPQGHRAALDVPDLGAQGLEQHLGQRPGRGDPHPDGEAVPVGVLGVRLGDGTAAAHDGAVVPVGEELVRGGAAGGGRVGRERGGEGLLGHRGSALLRSVPSVASGSAVRLRNAPGSRAGTRNAKRVLPVRLPSRTGSTLHLPSAAPPSPRGSTGR